MESESKTLFNPFRVVIAVRGPRLLVLNPFRVQVCESSHNPEGIEYK